MQGPAKIATYIGVGMTLLGFALIALAWNGAAELDFIQGQFPYVLSGGLGGLGLVIAGMAVLAIQTQRTITAERARDMGRLQHEVDQLIRHTVKPGPGEMIEDETIIDVGARTVVRTIDRRPAPEGRPTTGALPREADRPAGGFAPKPRAADARSAELVEDDRVTSVAVLARDDAPADEAWAPQGATDGGAERVRQRLARVNGVGPAKQRVLGAEALGDVALR
jgi:hypothetical protein